MKKAKKIGLSLNKKIVSNLQANEITGGGWTHQDGGCTAANYTMVASCAAGCTAHRQCHGEIQ